jgi:hypothetical protein
VQVVPKQDAIGVVLRRMRVPGSTHTNITARPSTRYVGTSRTVNGSASGL